MKLINPSAKPVAQRIDKLFRNERDPGYYTTGPLNPAQQKKLDAVTDEMHGYLTLKWNEHKNLTTHEGRLDKVRGNANDVNKYLKNRAAYSYVSRAADDVLSNLHSRVKNGIPLHKQGGTGGALAAPTTDAGVSLTRSNSLTGSAITNDNVAFEAPAA